jgi:hypothetical protein
MRVLLGQLALRIVPGKRGQESGAVGNVVAHERRVAGYFMSGGRSFISTSRLPTTLQDRTRSEDVLRIAGRACCAAQKKARGAAEFGTAGDFGTRR